MRENLSDPRSASGLYSPLYGEKGEIRLVTIKPIRSRSPIQCNLHRVSLKDIREEYSCFVKSADQAGKPARRILVEWAQSYQMQHGDQPSSVDQPTVSKPSSTSCRFNWGDFATLSYVWGNERDRRDILLNGTVFSVTANLEICLRALAADNEFQDRYKIWVDAICINQDDEVERASQVIKMREIYNGSWKVIAWLGESDRRGDMGKAFQLLRNMASLSPEEQDLAQVMTARPGFIEESSFFALHEMMTRQYWSRLWVVQEVIMGASSTVLRCGTDWLDWKSFSAGVAVLYNRDNWTLKDRMLYRERDRREMVYNQGWQTLSLHLVHQDLRLLSRYEDEGGDRLGFRRLLEIAGSALCRDIRDKVFALTGMMEPGIANEVIRNYGFDHARLFAAVAKAFILHYDNLEPLRQANPWGTQGAPTWAADWTWPGRMRCSRPESNIAGPLCNSLDPDPKPETMYNADGGMPAHYSILDSDLKLLQCDGFLLDEVAGLGAPEDGFFHWARKRLVQCATWRSSYGDEEATASALYKALLGARILKGKRAEGRHSAVSSLPSTFQAAFPQFKRREWIWLAGQEGYYFKWEQWRRAHDHLMLGSRTLRSYFTDLIPEDAQEPTYVEIYSTVCRMVKERRFMLTKNGYFGWAPDNAYGGETDQARIGDLIAIIYGCSTPLVIRPCGDKFQVVGEAYVECFMDGEAIDLLHRGDCQMMTFLFC